MDYNQPQGGFFKTMAQRAVPKPRIGPAGGPRLPPQEIRQQAPVRAPGMPPPQPAQPPAQQLFQPPGGGTGGPYQAPPPGRIPPVSGAPGGMPGTGGGFGAIPPQATASSADVSLGPNFEADRARRLMMANRIHGAGARGTFQV